MESSPRVSQAPYSPWVPDNGDNTYTNPIIYADYSDPDVIRVGNDFYMTASSFNCIPGLPILHSRDLVNWTIIGHALQQQLPVNVFAEPRHDKGVWAPSLRFHNGQYWIFYGDPDYGIYMIKSRDPAGPWEPSVLLESGRGRIDPCPLWDDDGQAYLVHAWAKSRAGFNSILTIRRMSADGKNFLDNGKDVYDGNDGSAPTLEGPKLYKRGGYYYIFAPAGGVAGGWQCVFRSTDIFGPYEIRTVMEQGETDINGPHQGGYVDLESGESWFIHFQEKQPYGRIIHLNPMVWQADGWPVIGCDPGNTGTGNPVTTCHKPDVGATFPVRVPQTSDDFTSPALGLQWQWQANARDNWLSLTARPGFLRLYAQPRLAAAESLFMVPNLLLQKLPAEFFTVTTRLSLKADTEGVKAGLIIMGYDYAYICIKRSSSGQSVLSLCCCSDAETGGTETESADITLPGDTVLLRVTVSAGGNCRFSYTASGQDFRETGSDFTARPAGWIGAKVGLFCLAPYQASGGGYADFEYFRFDQGPD